MYDLTPSVLESIRNVCRQFDVRELGMFGSGAKGEVRPDSDLDLLVEFRPDSRVGLIGFARLERELKQILGREIDLVPKGALRPSIRNEVLSEAVPIYHDESLPAVR